MQFVKYGLLNFWNKHIGGCTDIQLKTMPSFYEAALHKITAKQQHLVLRIILTVNQFKPDGQHDATCLKTT